jgi:Ca2+/Na+ antiporter
MILKIKSKYIVKHFTLELPKLVVTIVLLLYISNNFTVFIIVFLIYFLLLLVSIWLLYSYYKANRDQIIYLSKDELKVVNSRRNITLLTDVDDIDKIVFIIPEVEMGYFPFDTFNYIKIFIKDQSPVIITNLMYDNIEDFRKVFDENKIIVKKKFICILEL